MIKKIISGAQTGADRGGLKAAIALGIMVGGWVPKGRRAEDGEVPEIYPVKETPSTDYPQRTEWNVRDSDATIIFAWGDIFASRGSMLTKAMADKHEKPSCIINLKGMSDREAAKIVFEFIQKVDPTTLNVAGSRESKASGIEAKVEHILLLAFALGPSSSEESLV
jgi:predicted Rossmann-fold nucleotide-binding protein